MKKLLICLFTAALFSCNDRDNNTESATSDTTDSLVATAPEPVYKAYQLDSISIERILSTIGNPDYIRAKDRATKAAVLEEARELTEAGLTLRDVYERATPNAKKAKDILLKIQKEDFPILRKNYVAAVTDKLWENNVDVSAYGTKNLYISFSAGMFADHSAIKQTQESIEDVLTLLRFKSSMYQWYSGASDPTYYNLPSKDDTDIN